MPVLKLLNSKDSEHAQKLAGYEEIVAFDEEKRAVIDKLLELYAKEEREYCNREKWDEISFASFLR